MKRRTLGDILIEMEPLMNEVMDQGLQWSDFLALMHAWLMVHRPGDREEYTDGGHPIFYYGSRKENE